jgi:hypothetical protein
MQWIDAEEVAARRAHDLGHPRQVLEVADAPVALGPQAVELAGQAPHPVAPKEGRHEAGLDDLGRGVKRLFEAPRDARFSLRIGLQKLEKLALRRLGNMCLRAIGGDVGGGYAAGLGDHV